LLVNLLIPSKRVSSWLDDSIADAVCPLKLGVLNPAGASVVDFAATLTSPVPNAANSTKTQEEKKSFLPLRMIMSVPPRKTSVADARAGRRSTDRSRLVKVVTEMIETYGMKVRSPVNMQTGWREDYSHREAKYSGRGDGWLDERAQLRQMTNTTRVASPRKIHFKSCWVSEKAGRLRRQWLRRTLSRVVARK
jgi:hypothetical protein